MHYYIVAIKLDPLWDDGYFGVGICLCEKKKWFEAIHFLKKALELNKHNTYYWLALADAEANLGSLVSALEAYQKAAELLLLGDIFTALKAYDTGIIPADMAATLPTAPANIDKVVFFDPVWWLAHQAEVQRRFDLFIQN